LFLILQESDNILNEHVMLRFHIFIVIGLFVDILYLVSRVICRNWLLSSRSFLACFVTIGFKNLANVLCFMRSLPTYLALFSDLLTISTGFCSFNAALCNSIVHLLQFLLSQAHLSSYLRSAY
jgi:hypothetical protein